MSSSPSPEAASAPKSPPSPRANATSPPPAPATPPPSPPAAAPPPTSPTPPATSPPPSSPPPPAPTTPAPVSSPPPPPSSTPPPSPPSTTPSPPSGSPPPSTTPSPPSGSSPSPPSSGNTPPASGSSPPSTGKSPPAPTGSTSPTAPSSSNKNGGSGGGGISTGLVVGVAIAGVAILAMLIILFTCCKKKKRRPNWPIDYYGPPPSKPKVDPYVAPANQWLHNAPPPADHVVVKIPPKVPPLPAAESRPPHPPVRAPLPPPPGYISSSTGSGSNYSGSENPLPPPSPGMAFPFSKSTFTYEELAMATDGFSDANLLGQGGFGYVHRGVLPNGKEVAVKQLKEGSVQGEREFQAEIEIISRVHHRHLVSLVGYCITGSQRMLVYEFVPNNTLHFHLHGKGRLHIDWPARMKIALGSAKGLAYLHEDCHPKIIHRDIKAPNILLDLNFEAKVADFGLAKFSPDFYTHVSTRVMGTFGYLSPEYASSGKLTDKSDVFSFGVVLLELITGLDPCNLVDLTRPLLARALDEENFESFVDPRLQKDYDNDEMARVVACAAACVQHSAMRRPRMSQVVRALEGDVSLADLSEGIKPGHNTVYGSYGSSDYDTTQYNEDMNKFRKLAFQSKEYGNSEYSGPTSEYGLNPSDSSSDGQTTTSSDVKGKTDGRE